MAGKQWISRFVWHQNIMVTKYVSAQNYEFYFHLSQLDILEFTLSHILFIVTTVSWESHGFSCNLSGPPEEAKKPQPWPAVFTFPSRGWVWLEQIPFVQRWSSHPAVVASRKLLKCFWHMAWHGMAWHGIKICLWNQSIIETNAFFFFFFTRFYIRHPPRLTERPTVLRPNHTITL